MITSVNSDNKLTMLSQMTNDSKFQILEFDKLEGASDIKTALDIQKMNQGGIKLRQVRIILEDSAIKLEPGALSYMKGDIKAKAKDKVSGILVFGKKLINKKTADDVVAKPTFEGIGEVFLEPSFGHFALIELEDEEIILQDGLFYACEECIEVEESGMDQTSVSGSGIVVLELPVPETEIFKCKLFKDTLKVDGDFVVLRTSNVEFSVEKSPLVIDSDTNGEGTINVYSGTGEVWLLPTKNIYQDIKELQIEE